MINLPSTLLLDLDDTILDSYSDPDQAWLEVCHEFADRLETVTPRELLIAILGSRDSFWSDRKQARQGRLDLRQARRDILHGAFARLDIPTSPLAGCMADRYTTVREEGVRPFLGAIDTLRLLREENIRLGLITNGSSDTQRGKIKRFALEGLFEHIQIEEEFGIGKPDQRAFQYALDALEARPSEAWMIGDDLEFDVRGAQQAGLYAVWIDTRGDGLPNGTIVRPDRIIRSLPDLVLERLPGLANT